MNEKTVVVLSGGLDSSALLYHLYNNDNVYRAIHLDFGKKVSSREIASSKSLCLRLGVPLDIVDVHGLTLMQRGFIPIEHEISDEADVKADEVSTLKGYVSGYHMVLSISAYYAQIVGSQTISIGVIKSQTEKLPNIALSFDKIGEAISILNPSFGDFKINVPFADKSKAWIVELGNKYKLPYKHTWSCLHGGLNHCGECHQCHSRKAAFKEVNIEDPTNYDR